MLRISDESYERVQDIIEDIGYCCEVDDDYNEWGRTLLLHQCQVSLMSLTWSSLK